MYRPISVHSSHLQSSSPTINHQPPSTATSEEISSPYMPVTNKYSHCFDSFVPSLPEMLFRLPWRLTSVSCLSTCSQLASEKSSVLQRDKQLGSWLYSESVIEVCMEGDTGSQNQDHLNQQTRRSSGLKLQLKVTSGW